MKFKYLFAVAGAAVGFSHAFAESNPGLDAACRKERTDQLARYCPDCPTRSEVAAACKVNLKGGSKAKAKYYCENSPWATKSIFERFQLVQEFVANEPETDLFPKKTFLPCLIAKESHVFDPLTVNCTASDAMGFVQVIGSTFDYNIDTALASQKKAGKSGADGLEWLMPYSCANYPNRNINDIIEEFPRDYGLQIRFMMHVLEAKGQRKAISNQPTAQKKWKELASYYNAGSEREKYARDVDSCTQCMNKLDDTEMADPESVLPCLEKAANEKLKRGPFCE